MDCRKRHFSLTLETAYSGLLGYLANTTLGAQRGKRVIYLFQRIIQNHFQWTRPSPGRLGPSGEGKYVQQNGFGHEDWNFNKTLLVDGYIYGYCYYQPTETKRDEDFSIAFATYTNQKWYLIGFYLNCKFVADPPVSTDVIKQKIRDLQQLGASLGKPYRKLKGKNFADAIKDEAQWLNWRVLPDNIIRTNQPIHIPQAVLDSKNYRITKPKNLEEHIFKALYALAESDALTDYAEESEFPEGREQEIRHKTRERNQLLIKKAKDSFKQKHGSLFCEVCNFDFSKQYGVVGEGYIEAHHTLPVSLLDAATKTKVADIALVCSNCHRMLHRRRPWLDMKQLKELLASPVGRNKPA
jgi:hypothetical protein